MMSLHSLQAPDESAVCCLDRPERETEGGEERGGEREREREGRCIEREEIGEGTERAREE